MTGLLNRTLAYIDSALESAGRSRARNLPTAVVLVAPAAVLLGVFGAFPLFYAVYMSLYNLRGKATYTGLGNYAEAIGSTSFWDSFFVTVYYSIGTIPATLLLSFVAANCLFRIQRLRGFFRTAYFLPFVTSVVAASMVFRAIFEPQVGAANLLLQKIGLPAQTWLLEPRGVLHIVTNGFIPPDIGPSLALCCIMIFEIWHSCGFMIVIFLAGLSAVPRELEEAARIDGANTIRVAVSVTLPLLSPTVLFLLVVSVIGAFQSFNSFYAMTGDGRGPLDSTQNLTVYIFSNFYEYGRLGYGAAVATLLCLILMVLTLAQWRFLGRRVYYQ